MRATLVVVVAAALGGACDRGAPAPRTHHVAIRAMQFDPAALTVAVGDTVVWTNHDVVPHTVTAAAAFDSGHLVRDGRWQRTVTTRGDLRYTCTYHPTMHGRLVVR